MFVKHDSVFNDQSDIINSIPVTKVNVHINILIGSTTLNGHSNIINP